MLCAGWYTEGGGVGRGKRDTCHRDPSSPRMGNQVVTPAKKFLSLAKLKKVNSD